MQKCKGLQGTSGWQEEKAAGRGCGPGRSGCCRMTTELKRRKQRLLICLSLSGPGQQGGSPRTKEKSVFNYKKAIQ